MRQVWSRIADDVIRACQSHIHGDIALRMKSMLPSEESYQTHIARSTVVGIDVQDPISNGTNHFVEQCLSSVIIKRRKDWPAVLCT
jgi:hypothetical protein